MNLIFRFLKLYPELRSVTYSRDSSVGPSARASLRMTKNFVPVCLSATADRLPAEAGFRRCAFVPLFLISDIRFPRYIFCIFYFVFCISVLGQDQPGVWESHGPYKHAQTTAFYVDSTTSRIYVATAQHGVFVSENNGISWQELTTPLDTASVDRFVQINGTLFASTVGNLYISYDGLNWIKAEAPSANVHPADKMNLPSDFIVDFESVFYTGALWGEGLFVSYDNGVHWDPVSTSFNDYLVTSFTQTGEKIYAATLENGVYYSSDGINWLHGSAVLEGKSVTHLLHDNGVLLAGGHDGLFICTDGSNWNPAPFPLDTLNVSLLYSDAGILYTATTGCSCGLYYSDDDGTSWNQTLAGEDIYCIQAAQEQTYVGTASAIFSSRSGTFNWDKVQVQTDSLGLMAFDTAPHVVYALTGKGVFKSAAGENHWFPTKSVQGRERLHGLIVDDFYILTYGSNVYRSLDYGLTWETNTPINWGQEKILKILESADGFIAAAGGIFRSQDGLNWEHITSSLDGTTITTLESLENNFLAGTAEDGIFYSGEDGITWNQAGAPMNNQYVYFIYKSDNTLYAGTQNGLFRSDNTGIEWLRVSDIPDTVDVISFTVSGLRFLAGTAGQGIYSSRDNGVIWDHLVAPFNSRYIKYLYSHMFTVIAATDQAESYISLNGGISWSPIGQLAGKYQITDFSSVQDALFLSVWDKESERAAIFRHIASDNTLFAFNKNLKNTVPCLAPLFLPSLGRLYTCGYGVSYQTFDLEPPNIIEFAPLDTSEFINTKIVPFIIDASGADSVILSEHSDFADAHWQPYQPIIEYTVFPSDEPIVVYAACKDLSSNISFASVQIQLDIWPPRFFYIRKGFLEFDHALDTCSCNVKIIQSFEQIRKAIPGQKYNIGPSCTDPSGELDFVKTMFWSAGETSSNADTVTGWQPDCPVCSPHWYPWEQHHCWLVQIPGSAISNKGLDLRIFAADISGNSDTLIVWKYVNFPLSYFSLPIQLSGQHLGQSEVLPGGTTIRSFRIVSVPFRVSPNQPYFRSQHFGRLGDYGPDGDWMFWSYEGDNTWIDGSDLEINDGSGYFILLRESKALRPIFPETESEFTTMPTTAGVWGEIPGWQLRANDWTLIGNPYRVRIELGQLKLKNRDIRLDQAGTQLGIYAYTSNGWITDDIALEPWSGLAVFLADSADVIVFANPHEPYARPPLSKTKHSYTRKLTDLEKDDWLVQIRAEANGSIDNKNYFGVRSDAQIGHDVNDCYEPPRLPGGISVCFQHEDWSVQTSYTSDIRAVTNEGYTWPLQVTAEGGMAVSLQFETLGDLPDHFQLWLIDETTHIARNLRTQPHIQTRIPEQSTNKKYKIIVGTDSFVKQNSDGINTLPKEFVLYQNYPNPFNPVTVIRYALPVEGEVTLQIFDVLGRVVQTPEWNLSREPGYYESLIDMSELASGIYFYRFHVDGIKRYEDVKKMVFLR